MIYLLLYLIAGSALATFVVLGLRRHGYSEGLADDARTVLTVLATWPIAALAFGWLWLKDWR